MSEEIKHEAGLPCKTNSRHSIGAVLTNLTITEPKSRSPGDQPLRGGPLSGWNFPNLPEDKGSPEALVKNTNSCTHPLQQIWARPWELVPPLPTGAPGWAGSLSGKQQPQVILKPEI